MPVKSSVTYLNHMGDDLFVVNRARTSFDRKSEWEAKPLEFFDSEAAFDAFANAVNATIRGGRGFDDFMTALYLSDRDKALIRFLYRGLPTGEFDALLERMEEKLSRQEAFAIYTQIRKISTHFKPFTHPQITLHLEAPLAVYNQLRTHEIGLTVSSVSYRYIKPSDWYSPDTFRAAVKDVKQGSGGEVALPEDVRHVYEESITRSFEDYAYLTGEGGLCNEQARMVLPSATMTTWDWTGSLYAFSRVCTQRLDPHAQRETQEVAEQIAKIIRPLFPFCWPVLMGENV